MKNIIRMGLIAGAVVTSVAAQAQTAWTDKVSLGGDLRFRLNRTTTQQAAPARANSVDNNEIRARLTASAKVNEAMTANFRLATHNNNLAATDSDTQIEGGAKSTFDLELAYGDWRVMQGLVVSLGKAPNPFWQAGKNEMIWDADLAFEGASAKWAADMGMAKPFVNATYSWVDQAETATAAPDTANIMLLGVQAGASMGLGDKMSGTLAAAYHAYNNANQAGGLGGNFWLANVGAELGINMVENMPIAVFFDWVENQGSRSSKEKSGYIAGVSAGALSNVGSWQAWYNYRDVGNNAVLAGAADSEAGAKVDVNGHHLGAGYMAWENTTVGLSYWNHHFASALPAGTDFERFTADLIWKF